jgi:hypothetical protein
MGLYVLPAPFNLKPANSKLRLIWTIFSSYWQITPHNVKKCAFWVCEALTILEVEIRQQAVQSLKQKFITDYFIPTKLVVAGEGTVRKR